MFEFCTLINPAEKRVGEKQRANERQERECQRENVLTEEMSGGELI